MATTKHTIPAGYDFGPEIEHAGAFFAWLADNQINPGIIDPNQPVVVTADKTTKGVTWSLTASTATGQTGTWPLAVLPTKAIVDYLAKFGPQPVDVSEIKATLDKLADARRRMNAAKEEAEDLRAEALAYLTARGALVGTLDGKPFVQDKAIPTKGKLNRPALEAEYPEIVERFTGADYDQHRLEFI